MASSSTIRNGGSATPSRPLPPQTRTRVSSALTSVSSDSVKALGKDLVVLGHAKGKSPKAGDVDFFLLSENTTDRRRALPEDGRAGDRRNEGKRRRRHLCHSGRSGSMQRLVGAVDLDGDNASEVLLEGSGYNMGHQIAGS